MSLVHGVNLEFVYYDEAQDCDAGLVNGSECLLFRSLDDVERYCFASSLGFAYNNTFVWIFLVHTVLSFSMKKSEFEDSNSMCKILK